ncbi:hypothetical protein FACS189430_12390 [Bacteroidia bacterium]|nr:hypothetical protein FACS189430_12390 [Bacteroidia bacterium]
MEWSSSDSTTVSVTGGKLKAKKAGEATITAKVGEVKATCKVTVFTIVTAKVENGNDLNSKVNAVQVDVWNDEGDAGQEKYKIASGSYASGSFTVNLPVTVDSKYLLPTVDNSELLSDDWKDKIMISNPNVKNCCIEFKAYKDGNRGGNFTYYGKTSETYGYFIYSDGDVTLTGLGTYTNDGYICTYDYNVSLKKGWNIVYEYSKEDVNAKTFTIKMTSVAPADMKWYYYEK